MVGEGKDGVQSTEMTGLDSLPKTLNTNADGTPSNINRPRLDTPTLNAPPTAAVAGSKSSADEATGWRIRLWRKMTSSNRSPSQMLDDYRCREEPYVALPGDGDAISAVYAELNSVTGSIPRPGLDSMSAYPPYHLNTYSEIHEPRVLSLAPPPYAHSASSTVHHAHPHSHPHHHTLHLQRMLSDGTYENAGYAMERGLVLLEHHNNESGSGCASTPSSAYYSDLSNSDRSAGSHPPQLWGRPGKERSNSSSQRSSQSLPHCCHGQLHQHHSEPVRARDLMPVALQVIPDNQQIPDASAVAALPLGHGHGDDTGTTTCCSRNPAMDSKAVAYFSRGGNSASLNHTSKRPLPPLPSRQLQRPQRRYAYAVNHAHMSTLNHLSQLSTLSLASETSSILPSGIDCPLACVPSEYVWKYFLLAPRIFLSSQHRSSVVLRHWKTKQKETHFPTFIHHVLCQNDWLARLHPVPTNSSPYGPTPSSVDPNNFVVSSFIRHQSESEIPSNLWTDYRAIHPAESATSTLMKKNTTSHYLVPSSPSRTVICTILPSVR